MRASDAVDAAALHEAKRRLRERTLAARDALPADARAQASAAIAAGLAALPAFAAARCVLLTLPFGSEWDAGLLARRVLAAGQRLALPRVDRAAGTLVLHAIADIAREVVAGWRGIPTPRPEVARIDPAAIDCVVAPGVAFDARGGRLGYGGGHFDRLLPLLRPDTAVLAGAFDAQIVDAVPMAAHDRHIPCIVTPARTLVAPRA